MPDPPAHLVDTTLSHRRWVGRFLRVPVGTGTFGGVLSLAVQLGACLALTWLLGGPGEVAPYWFYLPIVFAALRFGVRGAVLTAVACVVLAGPLTTLVIGSGRTQSPVEQVVQATAFVLVGAGLALILERTIEHTRRRLSGDRLGERVAAAIARGDVSLEYQPIWAVDRVDEEMVGAEVLVRWVDDELGAVPPGTFVPQLENADRLAELGDWVLEEACRNLAVWQGAGAGRDRPFHLAVNVSSVQVDEELPDRIAALLDRHGADPGGLVLELTERTVLEDRAKAVPVLTRIRQLGVRIAIDDFGTGYSSLAYLRDLDFDILKLDRSFIDGLGPTRPDGDTTETTIVRTVISLGQSLAKDVVVEGVETRAQLDRIASMGPVQVQGSLLSAPVDAETLAVRLAVDRRPTPPPTPPAPAPPATRALSSRLLDRMWRELAFTSPRQEAAGSRPAEVTLAGMFLAGAVVTSAVVLLTDGGSGTARLVLAVIALTCVAVLHRFRRRAPEWLLHLLLLVGTGLILASVAVDPVPTTFVATSAFLIWVTVYASAFFSLRDAVAHGVIAGTGFGLVLHLNPVEQDAAVWLLIMGVAGVAGFVVGWFARQLRSLAATDPLTGLPNRQAFKSLLVTEIDRAERTNSPLALALVDLDGFKEINDTAGHFAGDQVLAELPARWQSELRTHDVLARYGGDEFVVLLPNCPLDDAEDVLTRMSRAGRPTCSVGIVTLAWGEDPQTLLRRADEALYRAKAEKAAVRSDRSVPPEHAVGGSARQAHPAGVGRV